MIKPTVGRVVWYRPNAHDDLYGSDQPLAAHVAYVWSDTMVNLMVIDHNGGTHPRTSVVLRHGESSPRQLWPLMGYALRDRLAAS